MYLKTVVLVFCTHRFQRINFEMDSLLSTNDRARENNEFARYLMFGMNWNIDNSAIHIMH